MKKLIQPIFIGMLSAAIGGLVVSYMTKSNLQYIETTSTSPAKLTDYKTILAPDKFNMDFTMAAEISTPSVVHIKSIVKSENESRSQYRGNDFFYHFFRDDYPSYGKPKEQASSGSGVIVTNDGYIVTNHHVIKGATKVEVTLNDKRSFAAEIVGKDPTTDIALIKIDQENLPNIEWGNSDDVEIGEWVLAVGNPFNLASTVTAGIVSAKGRNINILKDQAAIESFIQTDAAVNPGNSGGALVDLAGNLVGINTAIATPTGTYAGYSFAVPTNIVQKVIRDLKEYGIVQRAYIGVMIQDVTNELAESMNLANLNGVYVQALSEGGAADEAGIKKGDIIKKINDMPVNTAPELQEAIAQYRPGDLISITLEREGQKALVNLTLRNKKGNTKIINKPSSKLLDVLGVELKDLSDNLKQKYRVNHGVQIDKILKGKIKEETVVREGFIITKMDDEYVKNTDDFIEKLSDKSGGVMFEGFYPGRSGSYYFALGLN